MVTAVRTRPVPHKRSGGKRFKQQRVRRRRRLMVGGAILGTVILVSALAFSLGGGPVVSADRVTVEGSVRTEPLAIGQQVPDFTAPYLGGGGGSLLGDVRLPVVLSFWAPWCPACAEEMPRVQDLSRFYPDVAFVSISIWAADKPGPTPQGFVDRAGLTFPTFLDDSGHTIADAYGIMATPTLYVVDEDRTVTRVGTGVLPQERLRSWIEEVVPV